ncbi:MAG: hypothetical protein WAX69_16975 [Victivallales bacterium]
MKIECIKKMLVDNLKSNSVKDALCILHQDINETDDGFDEDIENAQNLKALDSEIKVLLLDYFTKTMKQG